MILLQDNPRLFGIVPMSWSSIFDPAVEFFFCRHFSVAEL